MVGFLLPLQLEWNGYKPEELAQRVWLLRLDAVVAPCFMLWYILQAVVIAGTGDAASSEVAKPMSASVVVVRFVTAVAAVYILAVHSVAFPAPTADQDAYTAMGKFGRWIFLTRHGLTLQACHQVLSLISIRSPWLTSLTHGMSLWIAALGWFVTVQFFVLVWPDRIYRKDCMLWKERGVQFSEVSSLVHSLALPIAFLDLTLAKSSVVLKESVMIPRIIGLVVVYVVLYLALITINMKVTGLWPYGFMKAFCTDLGKWAKFIVVQVCVMMWFLAANILIFFLKTR